jgi:hypothetical protein
VIDPRMLDALHRFFPATATILEPTITVRSGTGEPVDGQAVPRHVDVPCSVTVDQSSRRGELHHSDGTVVRNPRRIALRGHFPDVTERMRATVGGVTFDILAVEHDSQGKTTYLAVEEVR